MATTNTNTAAIIFIITTTFHTITTITNAYTANTTATTVAANITATTLFCYER